MSEDELTHIVYSKNVIEFVTVANEYCTFITDGTSLSRKDFIERAQKILPLLYLKASLLPHPGDAFFEEPEKFLNEVDYNFLLNKLSAKLAQFDSYQEVFDPEMQFSDQPLEASIAENLMDIYQDLWDFISVYRIGSTEAMLGALYECVGNFQNYWGQKLVNGLRAIHYLVYGDNDLNEEAGINEGEIPKGSKKADWLLQRFKNNTNEETGFDD